MRLCHSVFFVFLAGCATTKPYALKSDLPNLTVQIEMDDGFLQRELAELYIYEVRGKCEQFYHGFVGLNVGRNLVTLPLAKDLIVSFVRSNLSYGYSLTNEDSIRFRPEADQRYHLRLRERNGSREVRFMKATGPGPKDLSDLSGLPMPKCQKTRFTE